MGEGKEQFSTIAMPFGLTDFAKALRELIAAFRDVAGFGRDGIDLLRRQQAGTAAAKLDYLSFPPNGFCRHLRQIVAGEGTDANTDELARFHEQTASRVADKIHALRQYREVVREQCGRAAAEELANLIDGPNGKFVIRYEIEGLISMWRDGKRPEDIERQAEKILGMVSSFNAELTRLHDTMFPPRGAPK